MTTLKPCNEFKLALFRLLALPAGSPPPTLAPHTPQIGEDITEYIQEKGHGGSLSPPASTRIVK